MKKVLLFSHVPTRDDLVDVEITRALAKNNVVWKESVLGYIRPIIMTIKPDVVILPEIRIEATRDMAMHLRSWGVKVVQRRCEMGITAETEMDDELKGAMFGNFPVHDCVDLDLVWGKDFAQILIDNGVMPEEKIRVVGAAGFDQYFVKPPPVKRGEKKAVLFATGFGYADRNAIYAVPEAKYGDRIHHVSVKNDRQWRGEFIDMIKAFANKYPEWDIFIRPHPGEFQAEYCKWLGDDVKFLQAVPVVVALSTVDVLIHSGSTMAYEAHLMGTPTLNFKNTNLDALIGKLSPTYQTVEELLTAFGKIELGKSNTRPLVVKQLEDGYFGVVDGKAHQRIADAVDSLGVDDTKYPAQWPKDQPNYLTPGVMVHSERWACEGCQNSYVVAGKNRDAVKCPWCGVANVKVSSRTPHGDRVTRVLESEE